MDKDTFFRLLHRKIWVFYVSDEQGNNLKEIVMGNVNKGVLAIEFEAGGNLSFPTDMGFLPPERKWSLDESGKNVYLLTDQMVITTTLRLVNIKSRHEMQLQNVDKATEWFEWTPSLSLDAERIQQEISSEQQVVLKASDNILPTVEKSAKSAHMLVKMVSGGKEWTIINNMFEYIVNHPKLIKVIIVISDIDISKCQSEIHMKSLYVMMNNAKQQVCMISGERDMLIELIGGVLIQHDEEVLDGNSTNNNWSQLVLSFLKEKFQSRRENIDDGSELFFK